MDKAYSFAYVNVKTELVAAFKAELPKHGYTKVKVMPSDPASPAEMPCIGINRVDDSESEQSIADASGTEYNPDTKEYREYHGTFFSEAVEIRVWHTNADERDKLYHTSKGIAFAIRPDLVNKGLINLSLRGGMDEQDSSMQNAPMVLYWSTITLTYLNPLDVEYVQTAEPISAITEDRTLTT
jgi:hypothetical protein